LADALRHEGRRFAERAGIQIDFAVAKSIPQVPAALGTAAFRVFQEALTNIARHAAASQVTVELRCSASELLLEIRDNGRGFEVAPALARSSLGLLGMSERSRLLGGRLDIKSTLSQGTVVTFRAPFAAP
jgi:signal transduction histidine kinase